MLIHNVQECAECAYSWVIPWVVHPINTVNIPDHTVVPAHALRMSQTVLSGLRIDTGGERRLATPLQNRPNSHIPAPLIPSFFTRFSHFRTSQDLTFINFMTKRAVGTALLPVIHQQ